MNSTRTGFLIRGLATFGLGMLLLLGVSSCGKKSMDAASELALLDARADSMAMVMALEDSLRMVELAAEELEAEAARQAEEQRLAAEAAQVLEERLNELSAVYFEFNKSLLSEETRDRLSLYAELLADIPTLRLKLEGHCDENGSVDYNLALGDRRANAVKDYMTRLGVESGRLETVSYGKARPVYLGHSETAWAKNRRVEFRVTDR